MLSDFERMQKKVETLKPDSSTAEIKEFLSGLMAVKDFDRVRLISTLAKRIEVSPATLMKNFNELRISSGMKTADEKAREADKKRLDSLFENAWIDATLKDSPVRFDEQIKKYAREVFDKAYVYGFQGGLRESVKEERPTTH